jgi:hypothetical protein
LTRPRLIRTIRIMNTANDTASGSYVKCPRCRGRGTVTAWDGDCAYNEGCVCESVPFGMLALPVEPAALAAFRCPAAAFEAGLITDEHACALMDAQEAA